LIKMVPTDITAANNENTKLGVIIHIPKKRGGRTAKE
jgi:hypothetical protein